MILLYHNDFDGLASAAILRRQLIDWHMPVTKCVPVDYGTEWLPWPATAPNEPFAVVDFQYHPCAIVWIDHHATTFSSAQQHAHFQLRQAAGDSVVWSAAAPSCAQVVDSWLGSKHPTVVAAANKIDQSNYASAEEFLLERSPETDLAHTVRTVTAGQQQQLLDALEEDDIEGAAWVVNDAAATAAARRRHLLKDVHNRCWMVKTAAVYNATETTHLRFAPFMVYPDALLTCVVSNRRDGGFLINLYKNPWKAGCNHHLGNQLQRLGGGGHAGAAVLQLPDSGLEETWRTARQLIDILG